MSSESKNWVEYWSRFAETLYIVGGRETLSRVTPSGSLIDQVERQFQIILPASYRGFIQVLGPGMLARAFAVYSPGYKHANIVDLITNNADFAQGRREHRDSQGNIVKLLAIGDYLGTYQQFVLKIGDLASVPDNAAVYYIQDPDDRQLLCVADSFQSFIETACLSGGFHSLLGAVQEQTWLEEDSGQLQSIRCFEPLGGNATARK